jgi:hypothetical protein
MILSSALVNALGPERLEKIMSLAACRGLQLIRDL